MFTFSVATILALMYLIFATDSWAGPLAAPPPVAVQIEQAARAQLEKQSSAAGLVEPQFELALVAARTPPPCAQPVALEALDTRLPARMRFAVRCLDGGGWRYEYIVRAKVSALVAVAAAPVAANEPLTHEQVTLERRDVSAVPDPISVAEGAVGQASRRTLRTGDILRAGQLAAPLLVKRGDQVLMLARRDGIEVSTSGEALDAGARGAIVRVKNGSSGQVVRMRVADVATVEPVAGPALTR